MTNFAKGPQVCWNSLFSQTLGLYSIFFYMYLAFTGHIDKRSPSLISFDLSIIFLYIIVPFLLFCLPNIDGYFYGYNKYWMWQPFGIFNINFCLFSCTRPRIESSKLEKFLYILVKLVKIIEEKLFFREWPEIVVDVSLMSFNRAS